MGFNDKEIYIYSWHEVEESKNWTDPDEIHAYGIDEQGHSVCLIIKDFKPFVHIELPNNIQWATSEHSSGIEKVNIVFKALKQLLNKNAPVQPSFIYKQKLYGTLEKDKTHKKFPYLICKFANRRQINLLASRLKEKLNVPGLGQISLKVRERNISPILQFCVEQEIPSSGWVSFTGEAREHAEKQTDCDEEYLFLTKHHKIKASDNQSPGLAKIMAWDIESFSVDGSFPDARVPGNTVFQISCVFGVIGSMSDKRRYLLSLGYPEIADQTIIVRRFDSEIELLEGFAALIKEEKPHLMTGWNIFNFDINYLLVRAKLNRCLPSFLRQGFPKDTLSIEKNVVWTSKAHGTTDVKFIDSEGILSIDLMEIVQKSYKLDTYNLNDIAKHFLGAKKDDLDHIEIFNSYRQGTEKTATGEYTQRAKLAMGKVGKYCVQDSVLVLDLFDHLQTWFSLTEMSKTCSTPIMDIHVRGQQVKFVNQMYRYCYVHEVVVDKEEYTVGAKESYRGAEVLDPKPGLERNVVPLDFSSLYPSLIIAYNMDFSTFAENPSIPDEDCHVMEWEDHISCQHDPKIIHKQKLTEQLQQLKARLKSLQDVRKEEESRKKLKCYNGKRHLKSVLEMSTALAQYHPNKWPESKVLCLNAARLTAVSNEQLDKLNVLILELKAEKDKLSTERAELAKKQNKNFMCDKRRYRFLKSPKGILPTIIQNLLDARKKTRKQIKQLQTKLKTLDPDQEEARRIRALIQILDQRQNSYKISANSMYGATGVRAGSLPFMPIAMCTTYQGRKSIIEVSQYLRQLGGRVIYGDTDSNYVTFDNIVDNSVRPGTEEFKGEMKKLWAHAISVASEISTYFPEPITLEFENAIYFKFLILTKKRYMYYSCGEDGEILKERDSEGVQIPKMGKRGVILQRRDNCRFMRKVYKNMIDRIFEEESSDTILGAIVDDCLDLFRRQVQFGGSLEKSDNFLRDLVITGSVGSYDEDFTPELGVNDKGEPRWKIGSYVLKKLLTDEEKKDMTNHQIKQFYLEQLPAPVQLEVKIQRRGHSKEEGQRLSYIITDIGRDGKQSEKIESDKYFAKHSDILKIDYSYYLKRLVEPLVQVFEAVFKPPQIMNKPIELIETESGLCLVGCGLNIALLGLWEQPLFLAVDVADTLGLDLNDVLRLVKPKHKTTLKRLTETADMRLLIPNPRYLLADNQTAIDETGLYSLTALSASPLTDLLREQIQKTVLPQLQSLRHALNFRRNFPKLYTIFQERNSKQIGPLRDFYKVCTSLKPNLLKELNTHTQPHLHFQD